MPAFACQPAVLRNTHSGHITSQPFNSQRTRLISLKAPPVRMKPSDQKHPESRATWMVGSVAAGAGAAVLASLVSMYTPPPSIWVPIAAIALAIGVFGGLAHWILSHVKGAAAGSSQGSVSASQALDFIKQRRSVYPKDMTGDNGGITQQQLELMLEAARWAPTHKLTEPWHFVVLSGSSKAAFEKLTIRLCQERLEPDKAEATVAKLKRKQAKDWTKVHCFIAICMKRHEEVPEWEEVAAVACGVQNMALAATSLGVGGYWSSWQAAARDAPEMHQLLEIDGSKGDRCLGVFLVGQPDGERVKGYRPKRQELSEKVVWLH